ncbi:MAG: hypothetical protein LC749_05455 [Actinobacteria bacterium]|nr:hypothetical protein [Actinomycetota bacterium]
MSTAGGRAIRAALVSFLVTGLLAVTSSVSASTLATLEVSTNRVRAGDEVSFRGWYYNDVKPVVIRWDGPSDLGILRRPRARSAQTVPDGSALVAAGVAGAAVAGLLVGLAVMVRRRRVTP